MPMPMPTKMSRQKKTPAPGGGWRKTNLFLEGTPFAVGVSLNYHNVKGLSNDETIGFDTQVVF